MRLHPPTTILLMIAASLAVMAVFKQAESPTDSLECNVAHDFIESVMRDGQWFTGDKPVYLTLSSGFDTNLREFLRSEHALLSDRVNPLLPLYFDLEGRHDLHLSDFCPGILERFPRIERKPSDFKPVADKDGVYDVIFFGMSVPAVSNDTGLALVSASVTYAGEDGYGVDVLLMRDKAGTWRIAYSNRSWIS